MCEACNSGMWNGGDVTPAQLKAEVIKLATEEPNRREECYYTLYNHNDAPIKPGCIVGQAIKNLTGQYVSKLLEQKPCDYVVWQEALGLPGYLADNDLEFVRAVQEQQDNGLPWGKALEHAQGIFEQ